MSFPNSSTTLTSTVPTPSVISSSKLREISQRKGYRDEWGALYNNQGEQQARVEQQKALIE